MGAGLPRGQRGRRRIGNNAIMTLTDLELRNKIHGLALLQRVIVLDHQSPLFIPAFVHETIARQHDTSTM